MSFSLEWIAIILSTLSGALVVSRWRPFEISRTDVGACQWWLGVGIGLGLASLSAFFTLVCAGSANFSVLCSSELGLLLALIGLRWKRPPENPSFGHPAPAQTTSQFLACAFYTVFVLAIGIVILRSLENPHGEPDAWTFWNLRARLFFRSGTEWRARFSSEPWHFPTYPQLLPMNVVRLWTYARQETLSGPVLIAASFTVATIGLLASALRLLRGPSQGYLGGIILASTPYFLKHGATQYADVPFGWYVLAVLIVFCVRDDCGNRSGRVLSLAGVCVGFAAWTKEEGWLLLISLVAAHVLTGLAMRARWRDWLRELASFAAGLAPLMMILLYFRFRIAPPPMPEATQTVGHLLAKLTDLSRYVVIGKAFGRQLIEPYSLVYSTPILLLGVYALFLGLQRQSFRQRGTMTALVAIGLMYGGYFAIYLTTSENLQWLLATTLTRLFLQIWPGSIFVALMLINSPEERRSASRNNR